MPSSGAGYSNLPLSLIPLKPVMAYLNGSDGSKKPETPYTLCYFINSHTAYPIP